MARAEKVAPEVTYDTRAFGDFARKLRKASPKLGIALRLKLVEAGHIVADEAQSIASEYSQSIPPSIKVRVGAGRVSVVAGGLGVALPGLYERGNHGRAAARGMFRHPVFGNKDNWVEQPMHPYLRPALAAKKGAVEEAINQIVGETLREFEG